MTGGRGSGPKISDVPDSDALDNAGAGYPAKSTGYPAQELLDNPAPDIRLDRD